MPYKDLEKQKEYNKERMRKARVAQKGSTKGARVTQDIQHSVHQCIISGGKQVTPTLLNALVDPIERKKLEAICASLSAHGKLERVYYGISGLKMSDVAELLETTALRS